MMYDNFFNFKKDTDELIHFVSGATNQMPSKFFYEGIGAKHWLTLSSKIKFNKDELMTFLDQTCMHLTNESFNYIDIGPGDFYKTHEIVKLFLKHNKNISFFAVDASYEMLTPHLTESAYGNVSKIKKLIHENNGTINACVIDLFNLSKMNIFKSTTRNKFVTFLGGTIANIDYQEFLTAMSSFLEKDDYLLLDLPINKETSSSSSIERIMKYKSEHFHFISRLNLSPEDFIYRVDQEDFINEDETAYAQSLHLVATLNKTELSFSKKEFRIFTWNRYDLEKFQKACIGSGIEVLSIFSNHNKNMSFLMLRKATE